MKRLVLIFLSLAVAVLFSTSCSKDDETQASFDESLIIGKWKSGTLFERYDSDKSGATWDTADDVKEEEAQEFTWTINKDQLEQIHIIVSGGKVPKVYTITNLTASSMEYKDAYGEITSFSKQ
ncbi:lipocalin family protein [Ancylomarina sp. DW003]|uniref:Lipocalin family protein n=1 Tax=Paralabilibaculum antarcticum TaxID=2912572 RepID=A0ABT5VUR6_9BACT|nr:MULTISPECIES: lipocalin family protein [Marinifilaceae]MDE5419150.1 lipocalin family protein [Labilibaculum sp. DW002]MDE5421185.1 lipocalin family protein [Ancylomarina sp. DW003]